MAHRFYTEGATAKFQERYSFSSHGDRKQHFAIRDKLPMEVVMEEACRRYQRSHKYRRLDMPAKPIIRVFKAQGKPLLVLRVGPKFVSAFTWKRLIHKAAFGPWKVLADTTLGKRWS